MSVANWAWRQTPSYSLPVQHGMIRDKAHYVGSIAVREEWIDRRSRTWPNRQRPQRDKVPRAGRCVGRSDRSRQRRNPNCHRRVGPPNAAELGLRAEVDGTGADWRNCNRSGGVADRSTQAHPPSPSDPVTESQPQRPFADSVQFWSSPLPFHTGTWPTPSTDRKSTRLNSSHTCISYAAFCF